MEFKIHEIFNTADRSGWPVLKRHQVAKFLKNFQVNCVLCSQESDVFGNTGILSRHRNELTERDWENAVQGLGKFVPSPPERSAIMKVVYGLRKTVSKHLKVIPLKLLYYQTFLETWHNEHS